MEPESNSDSEEKKDSISDLKTTEAMKEKAKGKRPMKVKTGKESKMDSETMSNLELITKKAQGIVIDEGKVLNTNTDIEIVAKSKGKSPADDAGSKNSKGKKMENVVKSYYDLRSGPKGMDIDAQLSPMPKATVGKKRKGGELKRLQSPGSDPEGACKGMKRKGKFDDDKDDMDKPAARVTRSSTKKHRRVRSL